MYDENQQTHQPSSFSENQHHPAENAHSQLGLSDISSLVSFPSQDELDLSNAPPWAHILDRRQKEMAQTIAAQETELKSQQGKLKLFQKLIDENNALKFQLAEANAQIQTLKALSQPNVTPEDATNKIPDQDLLLTGTCESQHALSNEEWEKRKLEIEAKKKSEQKNDEAQQLRQFHQLDQHQIKHGRGNIFDDKGNEATAYDESPSFRLKKITDLKKLVKNNTYSELLEIEVPDVRMKEASVRKERDTEYNVYTEKDRLLYLYFVFEKGMKNKQAAKAANVNPHTARKWKQKYQQNPEEYVPYKLTNLVPSRPVSQLDDRHKDRLVKFFDENKRATVEDAVKELTQNFENLEIKKSRVAEFMKNECNLSIKVISRHPTARNSTAVIEKRAVWVKEWLQKGMVYLQNCVFLDESGFDINMTRERAWSIRGEPAVVETPSGKAVSHTVLGAISSIGVVNVSMREPGNYWYSITYRQKNSECVTYSNLFFIGRKFVIESSIFMRET
ncbi:hypothetical protein BDC45DRAFT_578552 [Circinella umbellata]|nr:hypothetical protein BDC45DRAFT_578552 [Circinella umbellata]